MKHSGQPDKRLMSHVRSTFQDQVKVGRCHQEGRRGTRLYAQRTGSEDYRGPQERAGQETNVDVL